MSFVRDIFVEVATFLLKYSSNNFIKLFIFFKLGNQVKGQNKILVCWTNNIYNEFEWKYTRAGLPPVCKSKFSNEILI